MLIPLHGKYGKGKWIDVDPDDFWETRKYRWNLSKCGYVRRNSRLNGKHIVILLARVIMGLVKGDGKETDHINHDKLDNRKENLRVVTRLQNCQNLLPRKRKDFDCGLRGVWQRKDNGRWRAEAKINGKKYCLGTFGTMQEAGAVAKAFRFDNMTHTVE